jgi:hypothetical protein
MRVSSLNPAMPYSSVRLACVWHLQGAYLWHIASFRCAAEFGRYRGIADIDHAALIKLDL